MQFNCLNIISRPIFNELNYITFFSEILFLETLLRCTREKNLHKILDVNAFEVLCVYIKKKNPFDRIFRVARGLENISVNRRISFGLNGSFPTKPTSINFVTRV